MLDNTGKVLQASAIADFVEGRSQIGYGVQAEEYRGAIARLR